MSCQIPFGLGNDFILFSVSVRILRNRYAQVNASEYLASLVSHQPSVGQQACSCYF